MKPNENRFKRLHVHGYRRLADVEIETRPLTVLIGAIWHRLPRYDSIHAP